MDIVKILRSMVNLPKVANASRLPIASTPHDVVYSENKLRLLRFRRPAGEGGTVSEEASLSVGEGAAPVFIVPSLINRYYILDLMPGRSFIEYLVRQGLDVYIVDWGTPTDEDRFTTFDTYCDDILGRLIGRVCDASGSRQVALFGYCMGGIFTAVHAALYPERVRKMVQLAAPVDFHDEGLLSLWTRSENMDVDRLVDGLGNIPWEVLQATFHMLKPTLTASKTVYLGNNLWDDEFVDGFVAMEAWANDNVSFPGECFRKYIKALYQDNTLVKGALFINGRLVELSRIEFPLMLITARGDHIVPEESALALADLVRSSEVEIIRERGGHIGAVASRSAAGRLWPKIVDWLKSDS